MEIGVGHRNSCKAGTGLGRSKDGIMTHERTKNRNVSFKGGHVFLLWSWGSADINQTQPL